MDHRRKYFKPLNIIVAFLSLVYFGCLPAFSVHAATPVSRFVAGTTGIDSGNCKTSTSPCLTIQYAINQANSGDTIRVALGTYTYNASVDYCKSHTPIRPSSVICFVDKSLTILGGFSSSDWSTANPSANPTVIDGQNTYRGVHSIGVGDKNNIYLDMEGFTIRNGLVQGPIDNSDNGIGGGVLTQFVSVVLRDVVIRNNQAIGKNAVSGAGGWGNGAGLFIQSAPGSNSLLQRVVFDNNQSYGGTGSERGGIAFGALFIMGSSVTVEDATFTNNLAQGGNSTGSGSSGGFYADALGGAIGVESCNTVILRRVSITGNRIVGGNGTKNAGGAFGAAIVVEDTPTFSISDSLIENNISTGGNAQTAGYAGGGAIHANNNGQVTFERVSVINNSAIGGNSTNGGSTGSGDGGGMYLFATKSGTHHATITNSIIAENNADQGSVGVTSPWNGGAGGIMIEGINADINHTTIVGNHIGSNSVLGIGMVVRPRGATPAVVNLSYSIIANHAGGNTSASAIVVQQNSTLTFNHGLFAGNSRNTNSDSQPLAPGNIIGSSTMSSASTAGFVSPGAPNYNYHIRLDSPANDQAEGSTTPDDIDGQSRPHNGVSDLGADEYWPFLLTAKPGDESLRLEWTAGASVLAGVVDHYEVVVTCTAHANSPSQGDCGQPINVGTVTAIAITGLSNFAQYTLIVNARDASQNLIANSISVSVSPINLINMYLPILGK